MHWIDNNFSWTSPMGRVHQSSERVQLRRRLLAVFTLVFTWLR